MIAFALVPSAGPVADRPAEMLVLLALLALVPAALVMLTSFLKISVVLSIARSALGAPQVPPNTVVTGLALVLTLLVMAPVAERAAALARPAPGERGLPATLAALQRGAGPVKAFLARFARPDDRAAFLDVARRLRAPDAAAPADDDLAVLAPAFVVSELRRAFTIGFLVFVPFLVVDLVISNVLLALGLTQLSPTSVALPFKLLLFVAVDGWKLLARALALSYAG
ncbi:type III secretion system export apparatus subunit SctR [Anaeromyxobacter dehalogenans]|uniref:Type III secretion system inner membrane P protein n=1 Tax=Anaeromyxobacter dehalogenans (strain 2CP-C) TaxID=290397 RepID=Q2INU7_ANADE|nr:type III secretion system export apparatus subunit SctR [Anaeromyxobacter dehalogenans]ABC80479.1 type III secretion system inner membrane P protein [Anaeromyxobacter dehalogenans 2CP-C]